jgi:hypothetical protein
MLIARSCSSARRATGRPAEVLASPGLRAFLGATLFGMHGGTPAPAR